MKFNINSINKKYLGVFATLILVILISQAKFFDLLINTPLGRAFLILFILGVSCLHKIFGVVVVLFIIITFNNTGGIMEGMDTSGNSMDASGNSMDASGNSTTAPAMAIPTPTAIPTLSSTPPITQSFTGGREGFNTIDRERNIQLGKRSSQIPMYSNARMQSDNIQPTDQYVFTSDYTSF
jgi:hypothetical protein